MPSRFDDIQIVLLDVLERLEALEKLHPETEFTYVHHRQKVTHEPKVLTELDRLRFTAIYGGNVRDGYDENHH